MNLAQSFCVDEDGRLVRRDISGPSVLVYELGRQPKATTPYEKQIVRGSYGLRNGSMVSRVFHVIRTAPQRAWDRRAIARKILRAKHSSVSVACHDLIYRGLVEAVGAAPRRYRLTEKGLNYREEEK